MTTEPREFKRYSIAFKQKVVSEIENGKFSINQARTIYDIPGTSTIQTWLKKFGKHHLLNKVVRIEMKGESSKIKELQRQKRELESALAQAQLKIICLESTIEAAEEMGYPIKKKSDTKVLPKLSGKPETNISR
jgi:transposase